MWPALMGKQIADLRLVDTVVKDGRRYGIFMCSCGNKRVRKFDSVTSGIVKSCGCKRNINASISMTSHGHSYGSPEYRSWHAMLQRCNNSNTAAYKNYGGRGISVCKDWHDFKMFLKDMGTKPNSTYTLDRIDVNGNYESSNCRWVTRNVQSVNVRGRTTNKLGYTGIKVTPKGKFTATISVNNKHTFLGTFKTPESASRAYQQAKIERKKLYFTA